MEIITFNTLDSTNTYCKDHLEKLADKAVVTTKVQTAGRGRFDRSWVDLGSENIYMTFVLKPSETFSQTYSNLTQYLSVVLSTQLEEMGLEPKIKWPNDVLLNGKKMCGILAEAVFKGGTFKGLVLGIGVNLNADRGEVEAIDRPATAINLELGGEINREEFLNRLVESFFEGYEDFLKNGFKSIKNDYIKRASFLGQQLDIAIFNKIQRGFSKGIDDNGALLLVDEHGIEHAINMGEIV